MSLTNQLHAASNNPHRIPVTRHATVDIDDPLERLLKHGIEARPEIVAMVAHDPMRCPFCGTALVDILGIGVITDDRLKVLSIAGLSEVEGLCTVNHSPAIVTLFECGNGNRWARVERTHPAPHGDQPPRIGMVFCGVVELPSHASIVSLTGQLRGVV